MLTASGSHLREGNLLKESFLHVHESECVTV